MNLMMKSIIIHSAYDLRIQNYPLEAFGENEIEITTSVGGVCGTDLHYYQDGGFGSIKLKEPMILGHEVSGYISKLGSNVKKFKEGDLVAISPSRPCNKCKYCSQGLQNQCLNMRFYGSAMPFPHIQGAFREKLIVSPEQCVLAEGISPSEAAMAEPLSVCLHATSKAKNIFGKKVLIIGSGPIGTLCTLIVKRSGASQIVVTDIQDNSLYFTKKIGVNELINVKKNVDVLNAYKEQKGYFDITFECSGTENGLKDAIETTKTNGTIIQVGLGSNLNFPLVTFTSKELKYIGSFRFHQEFPLAIDLMQKKIIDVKPFITHSFKMDEAEKAFKVALNPDLKSMKTQINFN